MNQDKPKRTPEEVLAAIEADDADDEAERILALSDEALDAELAQAGFDPKALRRKGEEIAKRAMQADDERAPAGGATWVAPVPIAAQRPVRARWITLLAATLGVAAVGVTVALPSILATHIDAQDRVDAEPSSIAPGRLSARQLRERGLRACDERKWDDCIADLDAAGALDPEGEKSERVRMARGAALDAARPRPRNPEKK